LRPVGMMTLNRNVDNFFAEAEQIAFGTGVLVDGLDFSDDKMLVGRTFSYSDTQRHRVGPNYLQLPVNKPVADVATNQADGQMAYGVDNRGAMATVNYEPSLRAGLEEADDSYVDYRPHIEGQLIKQPIDRTNNFQQAGERYRTIEPWERDDLVFNLVGALSQCDRVIQERMVQHLSQCDEEFGRRVAEGIGIAVPQAKEMAAAGED